MDRAPMQDAPRAATAIAVMLLFCGSLAAAATDPPAEAVDWRTEASFVAAKTAINAWLSELPEGERAAAAWRESVAKAARASRLAAPLRRLAADYGERAATLLTDPPPSPPAWLASLGDAGDSLRLAIAEAFASRGEYDACLAWSEGLADRPVFSPALMRYLRAVASQQTISDESATAELERFDELSTDPTEALGPARAWVLTALRGELDKEPEPLPKVVRRMRDAQRRLALSQPGDKTEKQQQTILDELDKLLEDLEEQRKQQQQMAQASGPGGGAPTNPAEESRPSDFKGPGEVDRKRLVAGDAWGSLPPAERERLTQSITRDFPPHYRGLIENYFKTLAAEADATNPPAGER